MNDQEYFAITSDVTDEQLKSLDRTMTQTHRLLGLIDELEGHPALTEKQHNLLREMYELANTLDNYQHERLHEAKRRRNIPEHENVSAYIDD